MNYDIKLIGIDLDGTALNDQKQLMPQTILAIQKAIEKGVAVVPTTGSLSGIPKELLSIPGIEYAITSNGSSIIELATGKVIYSNLIELSQAIAILEESRSFDCILDAFIEGISYVPKAYMDFVDECMEKNFVGAHYKNTRHFIDEDLIDFIKTKNQPVEKVQLIFRSLPERARARDFMKKFPFISLTSAMTHNIEINAKTVNKADGLLHLCGHLGIPKENMMACGDNHNDIDMLKMAGLSIVMGNAEKEIKELADYITLTNEENGVAHAIHKFVLGSD